MIGLISCSSQKLERPALARSLYSSPLFQKSLAYAERRCMAVYVLSAAHGLIGVDDMVEPYNRRLGTKQERSLWGKRVVSELFQRDVKKHEDLFVLAGEDYAKPLLHALKDVNWSGAMYTPLAGMQVGERLSFLNAELERMPLQLPAPEPSPVELAAAKWATPRPEGEEHACSFCGKSERKAKRMISSPGAFICDECVGLCVDILDAHAEAA